MGALEARVTVLLTLMRYSLTGLLLMSRGGAQESFTVREEKLITSGLPGVLGTSETNNNIVMIILTIKGSVCVFNNCRAVTVLNINDSSQLLST